MYYVFYKKAKLSLRLKRVKEEGKEVEKYSCRGITTEDNSQKELALV